MQPDRVEQTPELATSADDRCTALCWAPPVDPQFRTMPQCSLANGHTGAHRTVAQLEWEGTVTPGITADIQKLRLVALSLSHELCARIASGKHTENGGF